MGSQADAGSASTEGGLASDQGALAWTHFSRKNDVPICVFGDYPQYEKARFLKDVKKTAALRAKQTMVFGTYAPGCASRDCVDRPTLQCWAEVEGNAITVQTRYSGEHRGEAVCTNDCEPVTAGCETPALEPGEYTVRYGDRTLTVRVPGVLRPACLRLE